MKFKPLAILGAYIIKLEKRQDERGFLARVWDKKEFQKYGLYLDLIEGYTSVMYRKGTLSGLHFQIPPFAEMKLTRVIRGSFFEVIVDVRYSSPTFSRSVGLHLNAADLQMLVTPPGCAHGVLALEDNTEYVNYYSATYNPAFERGVRWNDPLITIEWPIKIENVSEKDKSWPDYVSEER